MPSDCTAVQIYRPILHVRVTMIVHTIIAFVCAFSFQALSVIDNVLLLTAFPLYCLPALVKYFYPEQYILNTGQHPVALVYALPIAFLAQTAIIWVTVLVGVNRYIAVCRPFQVQIVCKIYYITNEKSVNPTFIRIKLPYF